MSIEILLEDDNPGIEPSSSYCICTTPRSGSNLLMFTLRQQGIGFPYEYFNHSRSDVKNHTEHHLAVKFEFDEFIIGNSSFPRDLALLRRYTDILQKNRRSENGIFGTKIFARDLLNDPSKWRAVESTLLPAPKIIFLIRDNLLEQAISYYVATAKNEWFLEKGSATTDLVTIPYNFRDIRGLVQYLKLGNEFWNSVLDHTHENYLKVTYSQLSTNFTKTVQRVNSFLGVAGLPVPEPPIRKQVEPIKQQLLSRFIEDLRRKKKLQ